MNKFRSSYTVLSQWKNGNWEQAIKTYFKLEQFVTPAMADGKEYHNKWEKYIIENKALPKELGGKKLINPQPELKIVVQLHDWLELVGKIDCVDSPTIYEFKTGKRSSENYANDIQTGIYAVLATLGGIYVDKAEIYAYDQKKDSYDMSILWLTDQYLHDSQEWIETLSAEMHSYFIENDLYNKYGKGAILNG